MANLMLSEAMFPLHLRFRKTKIEKLKTGNGNFSNIAERFLRSQEVGFFLHVLETLYLHLHFAGHEVRAHMISSLQMKIQHYD